jgi:hypothetical protein
MRCAVATIFMLSLTIVPGCAPGARSASDERACDGLTDADVSEGVADLRAGVESVEPIIESRGPKAPPHLAGAVLSVRATPAMSAPRLGRVLSCHAVRRTLAAPVQFEVTPTSTGFAVVVRSRDADATNEIIADAQTGARSSRR